MDQSPDQSKTNALLTYFITGVSRGLGREMARQLAAQGHRVIGTVRSKAHPADLPPEVTLVEMELTDLGGFTFSEPIDVLINSAAISDGVNPDRSSPPLGELTAQHLEDVLRTNSVAPLVLTQKLIPNLLKRSTRRVVFISSNLASIDGNTTGERYAYRASKTALNMIARTLAADLRPREFTVVAIDPGWVRTDMGGPDAPLDVTESITGVLETIASLTTQDNGTFLDRHALRVPW